MNVHFAGLIPFFDFIVSINGKHLALEYESISIINQNINKNVLLSVFNSRTEKLRDVVLVPSNTWGGAGSAGITVRYCTYNQANEHVWHVLDVHENSPALKAGLEPFTDYIVGTPEVLFTSSDDFHTFIEVNNEQSVPIYVYSTKSDRVRLVDITPNKKWGGNGFLGCDIGYGVLHRVPSLPQNPPTPVTTPTVTTPNIKTSEKPNPFKEEDMDHYGQI